MQRVFYVLWWKGRNSVVTMCIAAVRQGERRAMMVHQGFDDPCRALGKSSDGLFLPEPQVLAED